MRRLAQQTREDVYASVRDYQELHQARGQGFRVEGHGPHRLTFIADPSFLANSDVVGAAVYIWPSEPVMVEVTITCDGKGMRATSQLGGGHWNRVGVATDASTPTEITVEIDWDGEVDLSIWGLSAGPLELPDSLIAAGVTAADLNKTHLAPETFYLVQDVAVGLDLDEEHSILFEEVPGDTIVLKKCSYCQRMLPLDPARLGTLAFHKHNAKRTLHQNECRACKKWRINDNFNPLRTVDQLHESSVITRERKLFLREPERLQEFKLRTGAGLKSQVWERFDRRCFYCRKPLELSEVQLDHTRPLAYLWPIDEFATCLCAEHNNQKTDRFPVDFYNEQQLRELSRITGLAYRELTAKNVNEAQLDIIWDDIVTFALEWEPRTFAATARKVSEMLPDVDLFDRLNEMDSALHDELLGELAQRPPGVEDV
ncbi:HNH endonuclease [Nocardioides ochotonae]|uniref:HNH endonuclease n=1 Tax=Nocardioides ochotonae TaxID=2685869 RepID=UPI00140C2BDE|nr:HNH endonuclease signature motif containing protein [Nocardioides ochotonae]